MWSYDSLVAVSPAQNLLGQRVGYALAFFMATAALYLASDVLIPLALALLLSFLLAPIVRALNRRGLHRIGAVALVGALALSAVVSVLGLVASQALDLARNIPTYRQGIEAKVGRLGEGSVLTEAMDALQSLGDREGPAPQPVEIVDGVSGQVDDAIGWIGPLVAPIATAGLVFVFVIFMLLQWGDLQERLMRLSGHGRLSITTAAIEDASARVSRYLQVQLFINTLIGISVGIGLTLVGIPNAPLWGLLAAILRFIPYIGAWITAGVPLIIAFGTGDGWTPVLLTASVFFVVEMIANNVLEPWLYGSRTGISPVGILLSAVFWAWLWGPVGLVLATPLTVCLVVAGRYVPQLEWAYVLLSDDAALPAFAKLYQRLLALDPEGAADLLERAEDGDADVYDDVLIPALRLAERDRHGEVTSEDRMGHVYDGFRAFIVESAPRISGEAQKTASVICVGASDVGDSLTAEMCAHLLRAKGVAADAMGEDTSPAHLVQRVALERPEMIIIAALPPAATVPARERCRRLRQLFPKLPIVVGVFGEVLPSKTRERLESAGAETIVQTLAEAVEYCVARVEVLPPPSAKAKELAEVSALSSGDSDAPPAASKPLASKPAPSTPPPASKPPPAEPLAERPSAPDSESDAPIVPPPQ